MSKAPNTMVTVGQLVRGLQRMIDSRDVSSESFIDWVESIDSQEDVINSVKKGEFHPLGTVRIHIIQEDGEEGTAFFEPRQVSKLVN